MPDRAPRLGDVIDDYCPRCRLLLNHDVTSLFGAEVAKATCRTCHNTHDYRHAQVPQKRKSSTRQPDKKSLMEQVLASMPKPPEPPPPPPSQAPGAKKRDLWAEVERLRQQKKG